MTEHLCTCGRSAPDATLCRSCRDRLARDLGDVSAYAADLDVVLTRQARYAEQGTAGSTMAVTPLPFDYAASEAGWVLRNTLVGWVRVLDEAGDAWPANTVPAMARWLLAHVDRLTRHEAGDQAADEIGAAVAQVRRVTDRPAGRVYAGPCVHEAPTDGTGRTVCGADLYAGQGHQTVVCGACGASYGVDERRGWLLAALDDHLATATEIARGVSGLGVSVTAERVRQWKARGRVTPRGVTRTGLPTYRVGDILDLVSDQHAQAAS